MPIPSGKTQAKRPLTAKELRAVRRRRRDREKRERKEQGLRPFWALPSGRTERRNYLVLLLLMCPALGASAGWRFAFMGLVMPGPIILGIAAWILFTTFIVWSFHKAYPR